MDDAFDVDPSEELLRRAIHYHVRPDSTVSSSAFKRDKKIEPECSVHRRSMKAPEDLIADPKLAHFRVIGFAVLSVHEVSTEMVSATGGGALKLKCFDDPNDDAHCSIHGLTSESCSRLAAKAYPVI